MGLESALTRSGAAPAAALRDALDRSEHLSAIVADLDSLRSQPGFEPVPMDITAVLAEAAGRWEQPLLTRDRRLAVIVASGLPGCLAPPAAIRQILDVLISNALWHGEGTVTLAARQDEGRIAIEVSDEGHGLPGGVPEDPDHAVSADGHGRGLPLARSLAGAAGGSLELRHAAPAPVFSLSLPAPSGAPQPAGRGSNRYPTPRIVSMHAAGSPPFASLRRSDEMRTSGVLVGPNQCSSHTPAIRSSRE